MTGLQQNILIDCVDKIEAAILDGKDYKYVVNLIEILKVSHDGFYAYSPQAMAIDSLDNEGNTPWELIISTIKGVS